MFYATFKNAQSTSLQKTKEYKTLAALKGQLTRQGITEYTIVDTGAQSKPQPPSEEVLEQLFTMSVSNYAPEFGEESIQVPDTTRWERLKAKPIAPKNLPQFFLSRAERENTVPLAAPQNTLYPAVTYHGQPTEYRSDLYNDIQDFVASLDVIQGLFEGDIPELEIEIVLMPERQKEELSNGKTAKKRVKVRDIKPQHINPRSKLSPLQKNEYGDGINLKQGGYVQDRLYKLVPGANGTLIKVHHHEAILRLVVAYNGKQIYSLDNGALEKATRPAAVKTARQNPLAARVSNNYRESRTFSLGDSFYRYSCREGIVSLEKQIRLSDATYLFQPIFTIGQVYQSHIERYSYKLHKDPLLDINRENYTQVLNTLNQFKHLSDSEITHILNSRYQEDYHGWQLTDGTLWLIIANGHTKIVANREYLGTDTIISIVPCQIDLVCLEDSIRDKVVPLRKAAEKWLYHNITGLSRTGDLECKATKVSKVKKQQRFLIKRLKADFNLSDKQAHLISLRLCSLRPTELEIIASKTKAKLGNAGDLMVDKNFSSRDKRLKVLTQIVNTLCSFKMLPRDTLV